MKALLGVMADSMTLNPAAGRTELQIDGESDGHLPVRLHAGGHTVVVDVAPPLGGDDGAPDPVALGLAALGACQLISYQWWAARLDVEVDHVSVRVRGHADLRGSLLSDGEIRPGLQHVDVELTVVGPEPDERYAEVGRSADRHSPLLDLFTNGTTTTSTLTIEGGAPRRGIV